MRALRPSATRRLVFVVTFGLIAASMILAFTLVSLSFT
jgi:hypothetical protein